MRSKVYHAHTHVQLVSSSLLIASSTEKTDCPSESLNGPEVFRDFFKQINEQANADLENLIYYKASFHNYCILTPKASTLEKHGLSGKVSHAVFGEASA